MVTRPAAVVILAAGAGTRMKSETPKVLHEMCGRSLLGHAIAAARGLNPEHLVVVVRHERDRVAAHALECDVNLIIADQDEIKGTGRAVWCGLEALPGDVEGAVVVMAGDVPLLDTDSLSDMVSRHGDNAVTVLTTNVSDASGYGRIVRDRDGQITSVVEHRDASPDQLHISEINTSTYAFDATFLRESLAGLSTANSQGEMCLTDVVAAAYRSGHGVGDLVLEDSWLVEGCNDLVQLAALRAEMTRRINEKWMRAGVSIIDPRTTHIDVNVTLEADAKILPGTSLHGDTRVETGAIVGPGELTNTLVSSGATARHIVAYGGVVPAGTTLPPFSVFPVVEVTAGGSDVSGELPAARQN